MSEHREPPQFSGLVDVRGDLPPDHPLVGLMALGAYRPRQLTIYDALADSDPPLLNFPELYEVIDREIGFLDEDPSRFQA